MHIVLIYIYTYLPNMHAGDSDCVISCHWGRQTASNLLLWDADVQFRTYRNVDHELDVREVSVQYQQ